MLSSDPIHQNTGGTANLGLGASITVSLAGADETEDGSTVFVFFSGVSGQQTVATGSPPSGWTVDVIGSNGASGFRRGPAQGLVAGESSWNFTGAGEFSGPVAWVVLEYGHLSSIDGLLADGPVDTFDSGAQAAASSGTTLASKLSGVSSTYDGLAMAVHTSHNDAGTTPDTWDSHTDGFVKVAESGQAGASNAVTVSVSVLPVQQIGNYQTTATCSRTLTSGGQAAAGTAVLTAADANRAADLRLIDGAEHGVVTGNTVTGVANNKLAESVTAGVSVSATAARSGGFGWLYASTSAACNSVHYNATHLIPLSSGGRTVYRIHFRFPTLPGADAEMWVLRDIGTTALITLRFITATSKIGLKVGSGAEQVSDATITANQWFGVDLRANLSTTAHAVDWMVDYDAGLSDTTAAVAQTQATATGSATPTLGSIRRGWTISITATLHVDDFAGSATYGHYPIGDLRVLPVKVDPAGTVVLSGTSTNFGVMTGDGSVAAWNATNARNAVDDIPPDLSGTRDAAGAVLAHASDYIEFPADTIAMAAQGVFVRGVRVVVALWAGSATTATMRMSAYENGNLVAGISEQDPNAAASPTVVWVQWMCRPAARIDWTQAKLDGLTLRFGSNDATPDIMVDAFVFEVAVVKAQQEEMFGSAGDASHVTGWRDPDTNALIGMDVTTVGQGTTVEYEIDGVPQTPVAVAADDTHYEPLGGVDFADINRIDVTPDEPA